MTTQPPKQDQKPKEHQPRPVDGGGGIVKHQPAPSKMPEGGGGFTSSEQ